MSISTIRKYQCDDDNDLTLNLINKLENNLHYKPKHLRQTTTSGNEHFTVK
jgi:hypothetical protein